MSFDVTILVAATDADFGDRFRSAFQADDVRVTQATDGYEALALLENGDYDILLYDAGNPSAAESVLRGLAGDELSHMWRQVERRGEHMIIACVSRSLPDVATAPRSRFSIDPLIHARNRGADHHFWSDDADETIVRELLASVEHQRSKRVEAIKSAAGGSVLTFPGSSVVEKSV